MNSIFVNIQTHKLYTLHHQLYICFVYTCCCFMCTLAVWWEPYWWQLGLYIRIMYLVYINNTSFMFIYIRWVYNNFIKTFTDNRLYFKSQLRKRPIQIKIISVRLYRCHSYSKSPLNPPSHLNTELQILTCFICISILINKYIHHVVHKIGPITPTNNWLTLDRHAWIIWIVQLCATNVVVQSIRDIFLNHKVVLIFNCCLPLICPVWSSR